MGRKLRGKCRNNSSSCLSLSRTVVCQVAETRYIHMEVLPNILFTIQGPFNSQDQAFPDRKLQRKLVSIDNRSLKCVDFTIKEKNPNPKYLNAFLQIGLSGSSHTLCANYLAVYFGQRSQLVLAAYSLKKTFSNLCVVINEPFLLFSPLESQQYGGHTKLQTGLYLSRLFPTNTIFTVSNVISKSKHLQVSDMVTSIAIPSDNDKLSNLLGLCCFTLIFCFFRICDSFMGMHYSLGSARFAQPFQ